MHDTATDALLAAFDDNSQIAPLTDASPVLTLDEGYDIAAKIGEMRRARGEQIACRKIGFTNRTIWPIYNVDAPVWGWMYAQGVRSSADRRSARDIRLKSSCPATRTPALLSLPDVPAPQNAALRGFSVIGKEI